MNIFFVYTTLTFHRIGVFCFCFDLFLLSQPQKKSWDRIDIEESKIDKSESELAEIIFLKSSCVSIEFVKKR